MKIGYLILFQGIWFMALGTITARASTSNDFQEGYVVTLKGDTIKGFVLIKDHYSNTQTCVFKSPDQDPPVKTFTPYELKSYGVGNQKYFVSADINSGESTSKVFLECIVLGNNSLFFFQNRFFIEDQTKISELTIIKRNINKGDKIYTVDVDLYKGMLQAAMNDCSDIFNYLESTKLNRKDITQLFIDYYSCTSRPNRIFETKEHKAKLTMGLQVGAVASTLIINGGDYSSYYYLSGKGPIMNYSLAAALVLEYSNIGLKNRIKLRTGLSTTFNHYTSYEENAPANLTYDLDVRSIRLKIPFEVKYNLLKSNRGPYVFGGLGVNAFLKWDDKLTLRTYSSSSLLSEYSDLKNSPYFVSLMGGIGYSFDLKNRQWFIELNYDRASILLLTSGSPSGIASNFTLNFGLMLRAE